MTQAAASAALYQHRGVRDLEKPAWRLLATEVLKAAAQAEARHDAAPHILALWLVTLNWVRSSMLLLLAADMTLFCHAYTVQDEVYLVNTRSNHFITNFLVWLQGTPSAH